MKQGHAASQLDGLLQHYDGSGSIHVVIAVDEDFLPRPGGFAQTLDGLRHA